MLESEDRALPLSRGQLDIWLSQETGLVGAEWQLGLLVRIEGQVERVLLERAIRQAVTEASNPLALRSLKWMDRSSSARLIIRIWSWRSRTCAIRTIRPVLLAKRRRIFNVR